MSWSLQLIEGLQRRLGTNRKPAKADDGTDPQTPSSDNRQVDGRGLTKQKYITDETPNNVKDLGEHPRTALVFVRSKEKGPRTEPRMSMPHKYLTKIITKIFTNT